MTKSYGQIGYEAYNDAKGGLTYDGKPIPKWDELPSKPGGPAVQHAWEHSAEVVISAKMSELSGFGRIARPPEETDDGEE